MVDFVEANVIVRIPTGVSFIERFKRPYVVVHRLELIANSTAVTFQSLNDHISVTARDRGNIEGATLIGADELRSTIRY